MTLDPLAEQLRDELVSVAGGLGALLGPEEHLGLVTAAEGAAEHIADQLRSGDDDLVARVVVDLVSARVVPTEPEAAWWATPLARVVAGSIGHPSAEAVTYSVAAAMLGVHRGTVAQLVHRGRLDRHPDGGITVVSIRQRLAG